MWIFFTGSILWRCFKGWLSCTSTDTFTETWSRKTFFAWSVSLNHKQFMMVNLIYVVLFRQKAIQCQSVSGSVRPFSWVFNICLIRVRTLWRLQTLVLLVRFVLVLPTRTMSPPAGIGRLRFCWEGIFGLSFLFFPFSFSCDWWPQARISLQWKAISGQTSAPLSTFLPIVESKLNYQYYWQPKHFFSFHLFI